MAESDFEKTLRNRLSGLEAPVDDSAWDLIEKQLPPKNNPTPVLMILIALLLLGIVGYMFWDKGNDPDKAGLSAETNIESTTTDAADQAIGSQSTSPLQDDVQGKDDAKAAGDLPAQGDNPDDFAVSSYEVSIVDKAVARTASSASVYNDTKAGVNRGQSLVAGASVSRIGLKALTGLGAYMYAGPDEPTRLEFEDGESAVFPKKVKNPAYAGLSITPTSSYNNFMPVTDDKALMNRIDVDGLSGRLSLHAGLTYQQYLSNRWSFMASAGYMISRYQFSYQYSIPGDEYNLTQTEEGYFIQSVAESVTETVDMTNHYLSAGLTTFYTFDKDRYR
ncbi:MAG: hypothetical protein WBG62_14885, partial [Cyclobacteriaceae bacterium]